MTLSSCPTIKPHKIYHLNVKEITAGIRLGSDEWWKECVSRANCKDMKRREIKDVKKA